MKKRTIKVAVIALGLMWLSWIFANPTSIFYSAFLNDFLVGAACFAFANVFIPKAEDESK